MSTQGSNSSRLWLYQMAAGAGAVAVAPAGAAELPFDPPGGLPIVVDTSNIIGNEVEVDLNGDLDPDFRFYFATSYGGGFAIASNFSQSGAERGRVQMTRGLPCCVTLVHRIDNTEYVHVGENNTYAPGFEYAFTSPVAFLDFDGDVGSGLTAFTPFRDRPGFIGVSIGEQQPGGIGFAGQFLINVNAAGDQLTILRGSYRDDSLDLRVDTDDIFSDGYEAIGAAAASPLAKMAHGFSTAGAAQ